ncbi:LacI family DNA-binding transcriptional regulator [Bacillus sp. CHD6a]|uniref:LacI family DNA-binding transcriptional regulator n=1 Tax=Bacillus sp. CHD6a TaxID=1643452 RepID=UPI0006CC8E4E|nr:LacI family DNA-binding transcriptional regulator [Bacillus sp. CHD6a]KPB03425.1 transcriptional regulator [Bacillus sp. CHD6a]
MPTILDIARVSGVSKSTVSRVLNNHPHVSAESRQKVEQAIQSLSYVRNNQAVHLRLQTTETIGILVPVLDHPYFSQLVSILSKACHNQGYRTVVYQTFYSEQTEREVYEGLLHKEMDALVITYSSLTECEIKEKVGSSAVVICNEKLEGTLFDVISVDEEEALFVATSHLLGQGRRKLVFCCDHQTSPLQQKRWEGFKRAHEAYHLPSTKSQLYDQIISIENGIQLGDKLFQHKGRVDGILAGSDFVAAGLLRSATINGISIPRDASIIGFDNHPICLTTTPPLSSIAYSFDELVTGVMDCLVLRLQGEALSPATIQIKPKLVIRGTA